MVKNPINFEFSKIIIMIKKISLENQLKYKHYELFYRHGEISYFNGVLNQDKEIKQYKRIGKI